MNDKDGAPAEAGNGFDDAVVGMGLNAQPIIPWIGGKRRLVAEILPWFEPHTCYVEPFAGAAALLFNKVPSKVEVLNDVNTELVNLYRVVRHHLEEFVRQFRWALTSRKLFEWTQGTPPETLTDIQRAARFFYLQKLAFGAKVEGQTFGVATTSTQALNLLRIEEDLTRCALEAEPRGDRAHGLGEVHRALRQAAHAVLSATRRIGEPRAMAWALDWTSTIGWPSCCGPSKARRS